MADDGDEDHHHQRHGDHRHPPEADPNSARVINSSLEKRLNGGSRAGPRGPRRRAAESGAGEQARTPSMWLVPSAAMISPR